MPSKLHRNEAFIGAICSTGVQWLASLPSKQMVRVRIPCIAPQINERSIVIVKDNTKIVLITILSILLIIGIVFGVYYILSEVFIKPLIVFLMTIICAIFSA